jgi:hypothetical protein
MNIESVPWLFAPALIYAFVIVMLTLVEIVKKTLVPQKWKNRAIFLGMVPLIVVLLIAVLSVAAEMLYLYPEYASSQQEIKQLFDAAYGYNNNLLIMIPMGVFYFIVLSVSQNKKVILGHNDSHGSRKATPISTDELRQAELKREWEEDEQISSRLAADEAEGIFT